MPFTDDVLSRIYDRTRGRCHICGKKLSFVNYASPGARASWEVEHSNPRARGGTNYLSNLYPACIDCNRSKGTVSSRTARGWHGRLRAPLSLEKRQRLRVRNALLGGLMLGAIGALTASRSGAARGGALLGAALGAGLGSVVDPER